MCACHASNQKPQDSGGDGTLGSCVKFAATFNNLIVAKDDRLEDPELESFKQANQFTEEANADDDYGRNGDTSHEEIDDPNAETDNVGRETKSSHLFQIVIDRNIVKTVSVSGADLFVAPETNTFNASVACSWNS